MEVFRREGGESQVASVCFQVKVEEDHGLVGVRGVEGLQVREFLSGGDDTDVDIGIVPRQHASFGGTGEDTEQELAHRLGRFGVAGADGTDGDIGGGGESPHAFFD